LASALTATPPNLIKTCRGTRDWQRRKRGCNEC